MVPELLLCLIFQRHCNCCRSVLGFSVLFDAPCLGVAGVAADHDIDCTEATPPNIRDYLQIFGHSIVFTIELVVFRSSFTVSTIALLRR